MICNEEWQGLPGHMVWTTAAVALDGGEGRGVQTASGGWSTSSEAHSTPKASGKTSTTGANTGDVTKATTVLLCNGRKVTLRTGKMGQPCVTKTTHVAFLITALNTQTGTLGLNVTDTSARITLLAGDSTGRRASRRLMPGLTTIVAETLLRRTILGDVADCGRWQYN